MTERSKKIVFAVFFAIASAAMGYAVYWMLFRTPTVTVTPTNEAPGYGGGLPQSGTGAPTTTGVLPPGELPPSGGVTTPTVPTEVPQPTGTTLLREGVTQAVSPSADKNGARFYNPEDGRFYRVGADGTIKGLGDKQFFNVSDVSWANTKDDAILKLADGTNLYYDFTAQKQVTLPKHWEDFTFAPSDEQVAAKSIGLDAENRFLIVTKPDGTDAKAIEPLGDNADQVHSIWNPSGQIVAWTTTGDPQGGNTQQILFVGQNHENFKSIIAPGQGFLPNWSPSGKQILYSVWRPENDNKPDLWISSGETGTMGANRKPLSLNTWADKCAWADDTTIICAVPQNLPANAGLMRSEFNTLPDDVYRVDLTVGSAVKINTPDQNYSVRQPVVNKDKTKLIFTDATTGNLYSYDLK